VTRRDPEDRSTGAAPPGSRRPEAILAALGLGLHALLLAGVLDPAPAPVRVAAAFLVLVMLPGFALVRLGLAPPGGGLVAPGWAFGFGVAWNAALVLGARALGRGVFGLEAVALAGTALLWMAALARPRRAAAPESPWRIGRVACAAIVLATAVAALYVGRLGPVAIHMSDGPDHVGTIRRIMVSGDAFPEDAFFRGAGPAGVDPRKGVWHPQIAVIGRLAGVDVLDAWRWLPALVAPLFVLNVAVLGLLAGGGAGAAVAAWALLLTYGGTLAETPLRQAVFSSRLADQLALAATAAVLADLVRPAARWRIAAVLLAFAATTSHLFAAVHLAVPLGALGLAMLVRDRGWSPALTRLSVTGAMVGAACLPFLVLRARQAYAPLNVIHTEPQGLLYLADGWPVLSIGFLWSTLSNAWVLIPLAWIPLWKWGRRDPFALWMFAATIAAAMFMFNPLFVRVLEPRLGYLMMRFLGFVPMAALLAWALPRLARAIQSDNGRGPAVFASVVIALAVLPAVRDAAAVLPRAAATERGERPHSIFGWKEPLEWMRRELPADAVVLADPITSYSIPMIAGRYVVTLVDQHSSPNDARALDRILDARDALDPFGEWNRLREVLDRYGTDWIALNGRFAEPPWLDYWGPGPAWFAGARGRFGAQPQAFEPVYDSGDFVVYRVHRAALDSLHAPAPPRPYVAEWRDGAWPIGRRSGPDLPTLHRVRVAPPVVAPGDTLRGVAEWRAFEPLPRGSYRVAVRLDRALPEGFDPPPFIRKPYRKLLERWRGERYRIRTNHLPADGAYGVDRWRREEVVRDSFKIVIPADAAPGEWALGLRMVRQPHFPNFRVRDYLYDDDLFAAEKSAGVRIVSREANDVRD
jgi:hypothetical protein